MISMCETQPMVINSQRIPLGEYLLHLGKIAWHLCYIVWQVVWNQQDDVGHSVVPERVVNGMAVWAGPKADSRPFHKFKQLLILDILGLKDNTVRQVARGDRTARPTENLGSGVRPESCYILA